MDALDVAARNQGQSVQKTNAWIVRLEATTRKLGFANDQTREAATKLIRSGDTQTQATKDLALAEDLARAKHIDLGEAAGALDGDSALVP